jgi:hypothetical protein
VTLTAADLPLEGYYKKIEFDRDDKSPSKFTFRIKDAGLDAMMEHLVDNKPEKCWCLQGDAYQRTPKSIADLIMEYAKEPST